MLRKMIVALALLLGLVCAGVSIPVASAQGPVGQEPNWDVFKGNKPNSRTFRIPVYGTGTCGPAQWACISPKGELRWYPNYRPMPPGYRFAKPQEVPYNLGPQYMPKRTPPVYNRGGSGGGGAGGMNTPGAAGGCANDRGLIGCR